jgi:hypothetical protein
MARDREVPRKDHTSSPTDPRHRSGRLAKSRVVDVVFELLAPYGIADDALELEIVRALPERGAQIRLVHREQAGAEHAFGGGADELQSPQKGSLTGEMNPISPRPSTKRHRFAVACRSRSVGSSGYTASIIARISADASTLSRLHAWLASSGMNSMKRTT